MSLPGVAAEGSRERTSGGRGRRSPRGLRTAACAAPGHGQPGGLSSPITTPNGAARSTDDVRLFEKMCLEGFQSGLSWLTILRGSATTSGAPSWASRSRRWRASASGMSRDSSATPASCATGARSRPRSATRRPQSPLREETGGSLARFLWRFEPGPEARPARITFETAGRLALTEASTALSKALKARGFRFVGPTTMYALMQAMGMVNDHIEGCCVRTGVEAARAGFARP